MRTAAHIIETVGKLVKKYDTRAVSYTHLNPVLNATLPKEEHKERDIWTAETLSKAMEVCDDPIPVSYTHLDVYKRHVPARPPVPLPRHEPKLGGKPCLQCGVLYSGA